MKIVIDIPEDVHKRTVFYREFKELNDYVTVIKALENGTQLPKGHGRLIDADTLAFQISVIRDKYNYYGNDYESGCFKSFDRAVDKIIDATTIIEADKDGDDK